MSIRETLYPYPCTNLMPMIHHDAWVPSTEVVDLQERWHLSGTSIVFTIVQPVNYTGELFQIQFEGQTLRVEVTLNEMYLYWNQKKVATIHYDHALVPSKYMVTVQGDTLALSDVGQRIEYRDPSQATIFSGFAQTLRCAGGIGTGHVASMTVYGRAITSEEEVFFLH